MALGLYKGPGGVGEISYDGTYSNPILWEVSERGGTLQAKFYLRMQNLNEYCTEGRLFAVDSSGDDETDWYEFAPDVGGSPGTYASEFLFEIPLGSEVPVWIMVHVPGELEIAPKDDIRVAATYIGHVEE